VSWSPLRTVSRFRVRRDIDWHAERSTLHFRFVQFSLSRLPCIARSLVRLHFYPLVAVEPVF
jgi:hypothetical protein